MNWNSVYFSILLILLLFAVTENIITYQAKSKKNIFIILVIVFICFCASRPLDFDKDIQMYQSYFLEFCHYSYSDILFNNTHRIREKGYILINKFFCSFGFRELIIFFAILGIGIKSYLLQKVSKLPITAFFIYAAMFLPLREFTQIRDAVATSFLFFALFLYQKRNFYLSIFVFLIAFSFHFVALIYLPAIFVLSILKREIHYVYLSILGYLFFLVQSLQWVVALPFLPDQLLRYNSFEGRGSVLILLFAVLIIALYHYAKALGKINSDSKLDFYAKITYIGLFFGLVTFDHPVLSRLSNALVFFAIILLTETINVLKNTHSKYMFSFILIIIYYFGMRNFVLINYQK